MITFNAPLWRWNGESGSWHFITVPDEQSPTIRSESFGSRRGFGSVRVEAQIGDVLWRTSVFPQKDGAYILPVKADVRRRTGLVAGDTAAVTLVLL